MPLYNLDWFDARDLAKHAGLQVRRMGWSPTNMPWIQYYRSLWWYRESGVPRIVRSTDFSRDDFLAHDWTTCSYSTDPCFANLQATEAERKVLSDAIQAAGLSGLRKWGDNQQHPPPPEFIPPA